MLGKLSVVVADDSDAFRQTICTYLSMEPEIQVVGKASNGYEVLECVRRYSPDILLLDLQMPGLDGKEVLRQISIHSNTRVIILSGYTNDDNYQTLKNNDLVCGWFTKGSSPLTLVDQILKASGLMGGSGPGSRGFSHNYYGP